MVSYNVFISSSITLLCYLPTYNTAKYSMLRELNKEDEKDCEESSKLEDIQV